MAIINTGYDGKNRLVTLDRTGGTDTVAKPATGFTQAYDAEDPEAVGQFNYQVNDTTGTTCDATSLELLYTPEEEEA